MFRLVKPLPSCNQCGKPTANLKSRVCEECKKERAARAVTTDRQLFTAVRALPHMAITKKEGGLCCKHGARPRGVTQLGD